MLTDQSAPRDTEHQGEITFLMTQKQEVVTQRHPTEGRHAHVYDFASYFYECGSMGVGKEGEKHQRDRAVASCMLLLISSHPQSLVLHSDAGPVPTTASSLSALDSGSC